MSTEFDRELQSYFTDVEHLRAMFKAWLAAPTLPKRLLVIHGVGGVGKSSLIRMFRLHAKSVRVPIALASGDEQKSALDVLTRWAEDLTADGIALPAFKKTLAQYRALYLKVEDEATKMAGKLTKEAAKTVIETAASTIPGIGPLVGKLGGMGVEALTDWLFGRGFKKPDVDLLLDPAKKLTEDFLADVTNAADKQRLVLMLDTYEQMTALEDWARDVAQRLPPNALLVIAGRVVPNWDRAWHGWMANAQVEELKPMTETDMRELIRRYYATMRGGEPDPKQVEAIIAFARGLPMVVTSAVQLWVKYGVEDFQAVKPEVVANLVDRLMEGVPKELAPALEAAAIVRWFEQPILRAVMKQEDVREVYNELRRFPFVRTRTEGLALHDAVREIIDENLRVQDAERHRELHERAAEYFEKRLEKATGEEAERLALERLYHLIKSGQETKAIAESLQAVNMALAFYHRPYAEGIVALLNQYIQKEENRCWLAFLNYRVALFNPNIEFQVAQAKALEKTYAEINPGRLRALIAIALVDTPKETGILFDKRIKLLKEAIGSQALTPGELADSHRKLGDLFWENNQWAESIQQYSRVLKLHRQNLGIFGEMQLFGSQAYAYLLIGEWDKSIESARNGVTLARQFGGNILAGHLKTLGWALSYRGELESALSTIKEALQLAEQCEDEANKIRISRRLAEIYDRQGQWSLSVPLFLEMIARDEKYNRLVSRASLLALLGISYRKQGILDKAEQLLLESLVHVEVAVEPIALNGLGDLYLAMDNFTEARIYFDRVLTTCKERPYYFARATLGLAAIDARLNDFENMEQRLQQVMNLSIPRLYNDLLSGLSLIRGHSSWYIHESRNHSSSLRYYQHALIYALRYNRFLLDEVLSGRPQGTPLRPIIPECLKRGEEGRRMLIALRDWWQTGVNDIGAPHPDTISPIPEGIPLLEAERIAREREPGDGSPQRSVVEQIERAL